jgi:D-alanyl-D-alanine dipeptidase
MDYIKKLSEKFVRYADLIGVKTMDNKEPMIALSQSNISFTIFDKHIPPSTGNEIFVRTGTLQKLQEVQNYLDQKFNGLEIDVTYGYRSLAVQTAKYQETRNDLEKLNIYKTELELNEAIHKYIAVPTVAGHPTGGAVDVRLKNKAGQILDFGTEMHENAELSYTFNPLVDQESWHNRQILRASMLSAGFAPYDGEWWHFSYGDKEWAHYYKKPSSLYNQLEL